MYKLDESFHMLHMASSPQSIFGWGNEKSQDSRFCIFFAFKNKGRFFIRHSILIQINASEFRARGFKTRNVAKNFYTYLMMKL